jgi:DNA-3-methyladenine glycosylase II
VITLRTAGLSQRKAEYILDLAQRFVDRRLDPQSLLTMEPKKVVEELCKVRGIGRWTAESKVHQLFFFGLFRKK